MEDPNSISATSGGDDKGGDGAGSDKEGILDKDWILVDTDKAVDKGMFMVLDGGGEFDGHVQCELERCCYGGRRSFFLYACQGLSFGLSLCLLCLPKGLFWSELVCAFCFCLTCETLDFSGSLLISKHL